MAEVADLAVVRLSCHRSWRYRPAASLEAHIARLMLDKNPALRLSVSAYPDRKDDFSSQASQQPQEAHEAQVERPETHAM